MSTDIAPLLLIAGLALLGLIPAALAYRKDRGFVPWWIYGAALFPVALTHAFLLSGDRGVRVPDEGVICPSCGEPLPRFAVGCRQCGWVLMEPFASQPGAAARPERAEAGPERAKAGPERAEAGSVRDTGAGPPPWNDEAFARVSRLGPSPEEPPERRPNRHLVGGALIAAGVVGGAAVALAVLPFGSWFGADPPSRQSRLADAGPASPPTEPAPAPSPSTAAPALSPSPGLETPTEPVPETAPAPGMPPLPPESRLGPSETDVTEPPAPAKSAIAPPLPRPKPDSPAAGKGRAEQKASAPSPAPVPTPPPQREAAKTPDPPRPPPQPAPKTPTTEGAGDADVAAVGDLVAWLQRRLTALGYFDGPVNGRADARTRAAIRDWQRSRDMTVTGRIDSALIVSLRRAKTEPRAARESRR
ncbi:MAG: hypothetical protein GEU92_06220 [Alphaproteobacteria bacterium]|nr:hypothetical protein [Alphaproteobacteria bacterium]